MIRANGQRTVSKTRLQEVIMEIGSSITRSKLLFPRPSRKYAEQTVKKEVSRSPRNTSVEAVLPVEVIAVHP